MISASERADAHGDRANAGGERADRSREGADASGERADWSHEGADASGEGAATLGGLLRAARGRLEGASTTPHLDAEVLLAHCAGSSRAELIAFAERRVAADVARRFRAAVDRRAGGVPVAYLTGTKEFYSLPLAVTPAVLVPRPETELLVDVALACLTARVRPTVCDLGTGSGAVALAIKQSRPDAAVTAVDCEPAALAVARRNGQRLGLAIRWLESSWLDGLAGERFGLIVANPPYIASDDGRLAGSLRHEPRRALDGGADGLAAYRAILAAAPRQLEPAGLLVLEHGHEQRAALLALAAEAGFGVHAVFDDLAGLPRAAALELA